jgi:hypothetical protein
VLRCRLLPLEQKLTKWLHPFRSSSHVNEGAQTEGEETPAYPKHVATVSFEYHFWLKCIRANVIGR